MKNLMSLGDVLMELKFEIYNLHLLKIKLRKENVGLYRDDGLGVLRNLSDPETERLRKGIIKISKDCGLSIAIKMNLKTAS